MNHKMQGKRPVASCQLPVKQTGNWQLATGNFFRRGNAIIEAALVVPILLSLAFGTVEFGYYFFVRNNLQGAAREGARAAILASATNTDVTSAVSMACRTPATPSP